jgi:hypothetical protein
MNDSDFPPWLLKHKRLRHDPLILIPLDEYCKRNYLTRNGAMYRIHTNKIIAYKLQGQWYVLPEL